MNWHIFDRSVFSFFPQYINTLAELKKPKDMDYTERQSCSHTLPHTLLTIHVHRILTHPLKHTQSVFGNITSLYWQKRFCRLTRMDSESIWNWSAYFALIKASALISDWQFKHCWCTGNTSVFSPIPLLIINKLGGVAFFFLLLLLLTSIAFFVNLTANTEKRRDAWSVGFPPLFLQQQLKIKRNVSQKSVNSACE